MSAEEWGIDKNWFVKSPRNYFQIRSLEFMVKDGETNITLGFHANGINIDMKTTEERDKLWKWLQEVSVKYYLACEEINKLRTEMQAASLAIQNKIVGNMHD